MELDRPTPSTEPLPKSSLPLKAVQEEPSGISEAHHLAAVAQPIPPPKNSESTKSTQPEGVVGSAEANAAATLGLLTSVANSVNQQHQQQQQQQQQQAQPSFTPINQPGPSPNVSPGPQLGPCPTTPNPLPPGYNKDQPICANCSTQTTPLWRRSHDSTHILCNACALFFKMKGRPRPISLKTDVIKSRNRSKGKSTSKDRAGPVKGVKAERGESHSRSRESDVVGRKSAPGGAEEDDDEMGRARSFGDAALDGDSAGRKARKTGAPYPIPMAYGGGVPGAYSYGYGYPHPPHPHAHVPYPPASARARSRSSDPNGRGASVDGRRGPDGAATPPTAGPGGAGGPSIGPYGYPPPGFHPGAPGAHPEGAAAGGYPYPGYAYPPYGAPGAYGAHPGQPGYYPPPSGGHYAQSGHPHPSLSHLHAPSATHAQSDSRSRSPGPAEGTPRSGRSSASASPPHPTTVPTTSASNSPAVAQHWPHPNPNYHLHQPHTHSPLGGARPPASVPTSMSRASSAAPPLSSERGVTLAPIASSVPDGHVPGSNGAAPGGARPHLPSIGSVGTVRTESPGRGPIPRHTSLFESRYPQDNSLASHLGTPTDTPPSQTGPDASGRPRGVSVSSNSPSVSGSSEGVRSPEVSHRQPQMPWGKTPGSWTPDDERRGRPERRFDDGPVLKGKGREIDEIDELDEDDDAAKPALAASQPSTSRVRGEDHRRMVGVETGLNELRVGDHQQHAHAHFSPGSVPPSASSGMDESSRSRSGARERGRSRGPGMAGYRSQSTSRARGMAGQANGAGPGARSTSSGRRTVAELEAENARLRTKNAELTFLNGLMQSRLGQLEGPGRVPSAPMTGLSGAHDEAPYADGGSGEDDVAMDQGEESVTPVSAYAAAADDNAELARLTEDPQLRSRLLEFLRAQGSPAAAR